LAALKRGETGIKLITDSNLHPHPFYGAKLSTEKLIEVIRQISKSDNFTILEQMLILAMHPIFERHHQEINERTVFVLSTTKGNVDVLSGNSKFDKERAYLWKLGEIIADAFQLKSKPIIVSNACVSGGLAVLTAKRLIQSGCYESAIVVAGDILSQFTLSGFFSFNAVSSKPCKPFSENRDGISIGEASACVFLSKKKSHVKILSGATANDANHISGPSRTGEGLYKSIETAMRHAKIESNDIDYISPHGTATVYNDAMETIAFTRSGLGQAILNPIKSFYGHTLGASALIETIISKRALEHQEVFPSLGYDNDEKHSELNLSTQYSKADLIYAMNTASGFGGCNMAMVLTRN